MVRELFNNNFALPTCFMFGSYLSAITEKITGRAEDACPDDPLADEEGYSTGQAKNDMGDANMDILRSEIACESNSRVDVRT